MRSILVLLAVSLLLASCGDKPTEPEAEFSLTLSTIPPITDGSMNHVIISNPTDRAVLASNCPGIFAERSIGGEWKLVWWAIDPDDCALIMIPEPRRIAPNSSFIERYGPGFTEPGTYCLGWQIAYESDSWAFGAYYTEPFEVVAP